MRTALICASPRRNSASMKLLEMLRPYLGRHSTSCFRISEYPDLKRLASELAGYEALVFSFPLYLDGVPNAMLQLMAYIEAEHADLQRVGAIANCGYYEPAHAKTALTTMRIWAEKIGAQWISGISVGAGPMLLSVSSASAGKGLLKRYGTVFETFSAGMRKTQDDIYIRPLIPRFLYMFAVRTNWRREIRRNGLTSRDLDNRLTDE